MNGDYFIVVIEDLNAKKLAGAATTFVEHKFIRGLGKVPMRSVSMALTHAQCGHIEDVVVDSTYRGKNFGLKYAEYDSMSADVWPPG